MSTKRRETASSTDGDYTFEASERARIDDWRRARDYNDPERTAAARAILLAMAGGSDLRTALHQHPARGSYLSKDFLNHAYHAMVRAGELAPDDGLRAALRMKPVRTLSGVATVAALTEPHACPGECLFCPDDARMPKSYLADEPGALRAGQHGFDPYAQVRSRLDSLEAVGHATDKVELLILGGTWTAYPREYRETFLRRCYDALNGEDAASLADAQKRNESAAHRNVGLVVETRPDEIQPGVLADLRRAGVTKIQIGVQSLDDRILQANCRGHSVADTRRAFRLLRAAGFKIHAHWMPNLLGATPDSDREDFRRLWDDADLRPDELKIYPTVLVQNSGLYERYRSGEYRPYTYAELLGLVTDLKPLIPPYCRVNRLARDIPAHHVVAGNVRSNLREDAQRALAARGQRCRCIRCREVRDHVVHLEELRLDEAAYAAGGGEERFLSYVTADDRLAGYLRLHLPGTAGPDLGWEDLRQAAIIREVHVYGPALALGSTQQGAAQHAGLGTELLARAEAIVRERGYRRLAVISAVGTRPYYRERGYKEGELYDGKEL